MNGSRISLGVGPLVESEEAHETDVAVGRRLVSLDPTRSNHEDQVRYGITDGITFASL